MGTWCPQCMVRKPWDMAAVLEAAKRHGVELLSKSFQGSNRLMHWKCEVGHMFHATLRRLVLKGCPACALQREHQGLSQQAAATAAERHGELLSIVAGRTTSEILGEFKCARGHVWEAKLRDITQRGSWCRECAREQKERLGLSAAQAAARAQGGTCLSEQYVNSRNPLEWMCHMGHTWQASLMDVRRRQWCKECAKQQRSAESLGVAEQVAAKHNGRCLSTEYESSASPLLWKCKFGHEWSA
eukprot:13332-Amphidinium_carterae.1